jgi:hypothetical protein
MGRYTVVKKPEEKRPEIHPIWRGIGFLLMILLPFIAFAGAMLIIQENKARGWVQIPAKALIPGPYPDALVIAFILLLLWVALFAILQLITFLVFKLFGPPRYGFTDVPPITRRARKSWRR